jgi:hypothetical protein
VDAIAKPARGHGEHAAELTAAKHTNRGTGENQ